MDDAYRICTFCVMDTSDPGIEFDVAGRCNHCRNMLAGHGKTWFTDEGGLSLLEKRLHQIRREGQGKRYDSVLGLSGGADSSYVALKAWEWGLRPLAVHVDGGWNSELAVRNIQLILDATGWELHTKVVNWEEMRDLQLAYLRSGVANQDVPQDHAFFAGLYHLAVEKGVRHVLNGGNTATEGILPSAWQWPAMDSVNLRAIHARWGTRPLRSYETIPTYEYYFWYPMVKKMSPFRPLNLMRYHKAEAEQELVNRLGWRPYPRKHGESVFTRFFQEYYQPTRFGIDKRRAHFSSLIVSGQMSRDSALRNLEEGMYEVNQARRDISYLCRKLRISPEDFGQILNGPCRRADTLPTWDKQRRRMKAAQRTAQWLTGRRVNVYS